MNAPRFSANLGFLWPELSLVERVHAAHRAGFDAVECHFPYDTPVESLQQALADTGLRMLGLNTGLGSEGDFGVTAIPGRETQARELIHQAIEYAGAIGCAHINVVPGKVQRDAASDTTFIDNLHIACDLADKHQMRIVIEPLNTRSVPGAYLSTLDHSVEVLQHAGRDNLKIMFDFFHMQVMHGNVTDLALDQLAHIGHFQFSSVPERIEPDTGELYFPYIFGRLLAAGWSGYFGAEYLPDTTTDAGLGWLRVYQQEMKKYV